MEEIKQEWFLRLLEEEKELSVKIVNLANALSNEKVPSSQISVLTEQLTVMSLYQSILVKRICSVKDCTP